MNQLFTRNGHPIGNVLRDDAGKPYAMVPRSCSRCGGAGRSDKWAHTGFTCFDCGGSGDHQNGPLRSRLYTADEIAKLDASKAKRTAKRVAAADEKRAIEQAAADARRGAFMDQHKALFLRCEPYVSRSEFVRDVIERAKSRCEISEGQVAAIETTVAKMAAGDARRAASDYVGQVGAKVEMAVTVERVSSYERPRFNAAWLTEMVHVTTLRDENGNALVVKSPAFYVAEGSNISIKGTVKDHTTYRDERQTVLTRVKVSNPNVAAVAAAA